MANAPEEGLLREYQTRKAAYRDFASTLSNLLTTILTQRGTRFHSVTHRPKDDASLATKVRRPDRSYVRLSDVTDLAGVRVITYFHDDVDRVAELVEGEFGVDKVNSVDKRSLMDPDRFGYLSLHYVVELSPDRSKMSEYRRFAGMKAEIQIRSLLQHVWAETQHDLGYKSRRSVPRVIRRRFARLAGMFEIADDEFVALRNELSQYEKEVPERIEEEPSSVQLDKASLGAFFQHSGTVERLDRAIAESVSATIVTAPDTFIDLILGSLAFLQISSISELETALRADGDKIQHFAEAWLVDSEYKEERRSTDPTLYQGISVFYLAYVILARRRDPAHIRSWAEKMTIGENSERYKRANKVIALANRLGI
jgi:putative GTP pyrophosphokinase